MAVRMDRSGSNSLIPCSALKDDVPKQTEEKNVGLVLKTEQSDKKYSIVIKPKNGFNDRQESNRRKVLSKYHGQCTLPWHWRNT